MCLFVCPQTVQFVVEDESEENLHSFQGNEAGQDLDYEPGLEFDDTELAKAAIHLVASANSAQPFYFYSNDNNNCLMPQMMNPDVADSEFVDSSLILEDNPLFSLDSTQLPCDINEDDNDNITYELEKSTVDDSSAENSLKCQPNQTSDQADNHCTNGVNGDTTEMNQKDNQDNNHQSDKNRVTPPNQLCDPSSTIPIDISSIYLHSPDELLEENFEEALREQYSSLPPLDPALDLTLHGGPLDIDENFDDIAEHGIVGVAGDDMFARKIITIYACRLPSNKTFNYAKLLR